MHIGHYFSIIKPGIDGATVLIADYHAPKVTYATENIEFLKNCKIKNVIRQKDVFNPILYFRLLDLCSYRRLNHMTQFKNADASLQTVHLFTYPILMAHDVANYDIIVVGNDQKQHLDFAKKILKQYNNAFNENLIIPSADLSGGRIMDLQNPNNKMSKSNPKGCIFLDDDFDVSTLTEDLYHSKMDAIKENFEKAIELPVAEDYLYTEYFQ